MTGETGGKKPVDDLRIRGIYEQAQAGTYMLRVKIPGGRLVARAARGIAETATRHAGARVHLTTRMSVEFHDLARDDLEKVEAALAAHNLTSRGACGGAVRGVAASTPFSDGGEIAARLGERINERFTGSPDFEGLPKKFKVGVDGSYAGSRHLIQDAGFVLADPVEKTFDVWLAGGLGREPKPAFLHRGKVPAEELLPLLEAVVLVYKNHGVKRRRLKHLLADQGREWLEDRIAEELSKRPSSTTPLDLPEAGETTPAGYKTVPIFAGELSSEGLVKLADLADRFSDGILVLTPEQDAALPLQPGVDGDRLEAALAEAGFGADAPESRFTFRVCPGSHECKMGLAPTRAVARDLIAAFSAKGSAKGANYTWAISGCPNSCAQPQLADFGIVCTKRKKGPEGERTPLYTLLKREGGGFGEPVAEKVNEKELLAVLERQL